MVASSSLSSAPLSWATRVQTIVTSTGLEAWLVEDYSVPIVSVEFAFLGGASHDPRGREGAAALLANLLDEGAGPYDHEAFHQALEAQAIELSFSIDRDRFYGRLKTLEKHVESAFNFLRLALQDPHLEEESMERMRAQMIAAVKRDAYDPDTLVSRAWRQGAFPNHPYSRDSFGTLESLPQITREDLLTLHRLFLSSAHVKIAVVGALSAERLLGLLEATFGALPALPPPLEAPSISLHGLGETHIVELDVPQSTFRLGLPGLSFKHPDYIPAIIVNHILGGGSFSSRLFKEIREKRGLAYSIHSHFVILRHSASFIVSTSTKNERAEECLSVLLKEIVQMGQSGPQEEELDKAKKFLIGSYDLRFDSSTKIAVQLLHLQTEDLPITYLDERNPQIAAVTLETVRRVAQTLFEGLSPLIAIAGHPQGVQHS